MRLGDGKKRGPTVDTGGYPDVDGSWVVGLTKKRLHSITMWTSPGMSSKTEWVSSRL